MIRVGLLIALAALLAVPTAPAREPELPRAVVDTKYAPPAAGRLWPVAAAAAFQTALDQAQPGDIIELQAGVDLTGNFILRKKSGEDWIYVRSSLHGSLPKPGERVRPEHAPLMPRIVSPNVQPALEFESGAHHYRFVGLEVTTTHATTVATNWNLVLMGSGPRGGGATEIAQLPHHLIFDRCYLHGTPTGNVRRGILLEGMHLAVIDSHLSDFHEAGADTQALCGTNGPGPFKITNNYLAAAGENVMFGGMKPEIRDLVPADIEVRGNHFAKPFSWKVGHPDYAGNEWTVKNLFELKNARRVLIEGNLFENCWLHAQDGAAILFTPRAHGASWTIVEDVTFQHNVIRRASSGISVMATDSSEPSQATQRVLIRDNLIYDISQQTYGGSGFLFHLAADDPRKPIQDMMVEYNTALHSGEGGLAFAVGSAAPAGRGFVFRANLLTYGAYGFHGDSLGFGMPALNHYFPGHRFEENLFITHEADLASLAQAYPADTLFATIDRRFDFVQPSRETLARLYLTPLGAERPTRKHPGADLITVYNKLQHALQGRKASD